MLDYKTVSEYIIQAAVLIVAAGIGFTTKVLVTRDTRRIEIQQEMLQMNSTLITILQELGDIKTNQALFNHRLTQMEFFMSNFVMGGKQ